MSAAGTSLESDAGDGGKAAAAAVADKGATDGKVVNIVDGGKGTEGDGKGAAATDAPKDLPTNWREIFAGDDKDALTALGRITDPKSLGKSFVDMRKALSKAQKAELPKDATPEQITEYRKANGIPEKADGYLADLPKTVTFTEAQKPMVGKFTENMLALNTPPQYVRAALETYHQIQDATQEDIRVRNEQAASEGREALMDEWGREDFKANIGAIENFKAGLPKEVVEILDQSRGPNGLNLWNVPSVVKAFAQIARDMNPAGTVVPGYGVEQTKALGGEIEAITKVLNETPDKYWADQKMQNRFRELLGARERLQAKG